MLIEFLKKDGRKRKIPIWFTLEGRTLELLPMYGLKTKWFNDVERAKKMDVEVKGDRISATPVVLRETRVVDEVKKRFAAKYGEKDVKRYYPTSEVALKIKV